MDVFFITKLCFQIFFYPIIVMLLKLCIGTSPEKDINGLHRRKQKQKRFGKFCRCVEQKKNQNFQAAEQAISNQSFQKKTYLTMWLFFQNTNF